MKEIRSLYELRNTVPGEGKSYLMMMKQGSEQSECALKRFRSASASHPGILTMSADVASVHDIHPVYGITSVPVLLQFEGPAVKNIIKGCQAEAFYNALLEDAVYQASIEREGRPAKNVTVYSTPTCTWCNTLKQWLRKNHIPYTDIDVSRDEAAARELVRRTGQQGVPQTDINGHVVVGFDQAKLKQLLEIQ